MVEDEKASIGRAIEFSSGAVQSKKARPNVYFDMDFSAPAGRYFVWIRGVCTTKGETADSIWLSCSQDRIPDSNQPVE